MIACAVTGEAHDAAMKQKNLGFLLLAIYLIVVGVVGVANISLGALAILVPILAIAAGVCLLIGR